MDKKPELMEKVETVVEKVEAAVDKLQLKGNVFKVGDKIDKPCNFIARALVSDLDKICPRGYYPNSKMPKFFLVESIKNYSGDKASVNYMDTETGNQFNRIIFKTAEFKELTGTTGVEHMEKAKQIKLKNLRIIMVLNKTIGADPEIFAEDESGNLIPAFSFLGSKEKPNHTTAVTDYGRKPMYWDGFQAEFTTAAEPCLGWVADSLFEGVNGVAKALKTVNPKAKLSSKTLVEIPTETLLATDPKYVEFGCKPSLNVYGLKSAIESGGVNIPYRSAGGHLHFGIGRHSQDKQENIVKALDAILAVACVSMFEGYDSPIRRQYYGLVGEYRLPPHGLEYRVLSNAWLFHPVLANLVFDLGRMITNIGYAGVLPDVWDTKESEVIDTVMTCNVDAARAILDRNKKSFIKIFEAAYPCHTSEMNVIGFKFFREGMKFGIKNPDDIEGNWLLGDKWIKHCEAPGKNWNKASAMLIKGQTL